MKHDVFISYKSQYIHIVNAVAHLLEEEGISCWFAPRNLDNRGAGKDYDDEIVDAIVNSRVVVIILCDEAFESKWVKIEVTQADEANKLIIPFVISELTVKNNGLRARLQNKHWIDAYPNPERKFSFLVNNVKLALNSVQGNGDGKQVYRPIQETNFDFDFDFDYEEGEVLYKAMEYNEAISAFLASAERGNPKAKSILCEIFYRLEDRIEIITEEIWAVVERLAEANSCFANFILHAKYYNNTADYLISFEYLKKAIKDNDIPLALLRLGIHYGWGMGVKQNHALELHYCQKAETGGCIQAYSYLGQIYQFGNEKIPLNKKKALEYYLKGAEAGDKRSIDKLVKYYVYEQEFADAKKWAQRAVDLGYDEGYCLMGDVEQGIHDGYTYEAISFYKEAVKREVKSAYSKLAWYYWTIGDHENAYRFALQGYRMHDTDSIYCLGAFYEKDTDKSKEERYPEAWRYYMERYNRFGSGMEDLGHMYIDLGYRPKTVNIESLIKILEIGASNAKEESLRQLIRLYSDEEFGIQNPDKVVRLHKQGAELGYAEDMYEYGLSYFKDNSIIFNPYKGFVWLERAGKKGYVLAIHRLIILYNDGPYKDIEKLQEWVDVAIQQDCYTDETFPIIIREGGSLDIELFAGFLERRLRTDLNKNISYSCIKNLSSLCFSRKWKMSEEMFLLCKNTIEKYEGDKCLLEKNMEILVILNRLKQKFEFA